MIRKDSLKLVSPRWLPLLGVALLALVTASPTTASVCPDPAIHGEIVNPHHDPTVIFWEPLISYEFLTVRISAPCGDFVRTFKEGETPFFDLEQVTREVDGRYAWELTAQPRIDPSVREQLDEVRGTSKEEDVVLQLWDKGALPRGPFRQAGAFFVVEGRISDPNADESRSKSVFSDGGQAARHPGSNGSSVASASCSPDGGVEAASGSSVRNISAADFVIIDDLIVDGSACIGFDCVNGESFGFDTIRLKENNLRIKFDDTSTAASFPRTDWQLTANDSANGGLSKFSIDDISGSRTPFTIEANAPSHSLYVDDGGRVGFGTSTPVVELHVVDGDTPTLRLAQDGSSGFAPQTWDVAGNETSFFIRDATNGSTLPFRIRPGASSNSLVIDTDDDVGVGTLSPSEALHVRRTDGSAKLLIEEASASTAEREVLRLENSGKTRFAIENTAASSTWNFANDAAGNFEISKIGTGTSEFLLNGSGNLTITGTLVTGGGGTCDPGPCDRTFSRDYEVESIEEHAAYMWENQHLWGVGPTPEGDPINLSKKTTGILHELEKAHIYIEQLHNRLETKDGQIQEVLDQVQALGAQNAALHERLDALERGQQ